MVSRAWARVAAAIVVAVAPLLASSPGSAQEVTARVRPARVRVGETFVVTVRVSGRARPDAVDLAPSERSEVVDVRERSSWTVGPHGHLAVTETEFVLRASGEGRVSPARAVAVLAGDSAWVEVPDVSAVAAPLAGSPAPPRRMRDDASDDPVRPEGAPPLGSGRTGIPPYPWSGAMPPGSQGIPYGQGTPYGTVYTQPGSPQGNPGGAAAWPQPYPGAPGAYLGGPGYGLSGWGAAPPGRGWAATADTDPAWLDLVPRLERYQTEARDARGLVTLEAGLTPERVYEGAQVTLVATATFAPEALARLGPGPELFPPSAGNAWAVEIPYAPPSPSAVGGRLQEAHTLMRAFFPVSPGRLDVEGVRLRYSVGSGGASYAPGDELATEPLSVEVLPIPRHGAPPGWSGAVGRMKVAAWVQPESVGWGEAAFLTVEVAGAGNAQTFPRPDPGPVWGAELRPVGERAMVEVRDGVVGGVKTFTWLVVPVEAAQVRIGPVIYSFFDPWVGSFGQVASGEIVLDVRPFPGGGGVAPHGGPGAGPGGYAETSADASGGAWAPEWSAPWDTARDPGVPGDAPAGEKVEARRAPPDTAVAPGARPGTPEADARAALDAVTAAPRDPSEWVRLASAFGAGRPGEGWRDWALRSGLVWAPRDRAARVALWGSPGWPGREGGVPALPLSPEESRRAALGLGIAALLAVGAAALGLTGARRRLALALGLALAAAGAGATEPWMRRTSGTEGAVVVEGPVALRAAPAWSAPERRTLPGGTPVTVRRRFGRWAEVSAGDGVSGWAEGVRIIPLGPAFGR